MTFWVSFIFSSNMLILRLLLCHENIILWTTSLLLFPLCYCILWCFYLARHKWFFNNWTYSLKWDPNHIEKWTFHLKDTSLTPYWYQQESNQSISLFLHATGMTITYSMSVFTYIISGIFIPPIIVHRKDL